MIDCSVRGDKNRVDEFGRGIGFRLELTSGAIKHSCFSRQYFHFRVNYETSTALSSCSAKLFLTG